MRLVGFDQGTVTLELDADECLSLARACELAQRSGELAVAEHGPGAHAERLRALDTYRSLSRGMLACARIGRRQHHAARAVGVARALDLCERRRQAIVVVD